MISMLWVWSQLCCISQELYLFTYTAVTKQRKLQHVNVHDLEWNRPKQNTLDDTKQLTTIKLHSNPKFLGSTAGHLLNMDTCLIVSFGQTKSSYIFFKINLLYTSLLCRDARVHVFVTRVGQFIMSLSLL